jgi:hypothetical protein
MYFERLRSLATGITVCGAGVGTFLFSKIISYLIVNFNWRTVFLIYAGEFTKKSIQKILILAVVLLCVPCGALYRPIAFEPIYDDEEKEIEDEEETGKKVNGKLSPISADRANKIKAHLLSDSPTNGKLRSALSHQDVNDKSADATNLQRVQSFGEHLHHKHKAHGVSISSLGYLNVKDVFYRRSVNELKNYDEKMRSVPSLPTAHKESMHRRSNKEILRELPEEEDENEDSAATSGSRAIELWR